VVKQLVDMHGGRVTARSAGAGRGSTFEIIIPLTAAPAEAAPLAVDTPPNRRRILIVDDNRDAADSLALLLQLNGHEVRTAYGGEEALEIAAAYDADFVLLDIGLPTINGYEVARRLRRQGFTSQLVALTGYGQPEDVRRARDAGFDGHVVKPVDPDRLLESLAS
jgi:CheY-like chemotaxis protein